MYFKKHVFVLALVVIGFASCKKDDVAVNSALVGTWEGKWGFDDDIPTYYEKWIIKSNGDVEAYSASGLYAKGRCSVDGLNFQLEYSPIGEDYSYKFAGLFHDALGEILGTWGKAPSATNRGTFEMYKQ